MVDRKEKSGGTSAGDLTANILQMSATAFGIGAITAASGTVFQAEGGSASTAATFVSFRGSFSQSQ